MIPFNVPAPPDLFPDALPKGTMFSLNMDAMKAAKSESLEWNLVQKFDFPDNYSPVMALAQNHIHFLGVGNDGPGTARIFVIHCGFELPLENLGCGTHLHIDSYLQPEIQSYSGSKTFPAVHGQVTSFFKDSGVQQEFAFIPEDFSATYVINVEKNSTRTLAPPPVKDAKSSYVAGITSLVQLDSTGAVSFVPYTPGEYSASSNAAWSNVKALASIPKPSGTSTSSSPKVTSNGSTNTSDSGGALSNYAITSGLVGLSVLFAVLGFF